MCSVPSVVLFFRRLRQAEPDLLDQVFNNVAVHIGQTKIPAGISVREFFMIEAEQLEHRSVQIVDVYFVLDRFEAELVGRSVNVPAFHAAASQPRGETPMVVISTVDLACV